MSISITWLGLVAMVTLTVLSNNTEDLLTFGLLWLPLWTHWLYYYPKTLYWFPMYFHLICYYLKHRLIRIENRLKGLTKKGVPLQREYVLNKLLRSHHKILIKINSYDIYWNQFLTQSLLILCPIILFLSYLYFFTFMPILPKIEFTIVLIANALLMAFLLGSASEVSKRTDTTYKLLNSYCVHQFSIQTKLKVSHKWPKCSNY